jgi:glycosyltransferase involved in cell wall biosynthesis
MNKKFNYIPKEQRKKIIVISDDIRAQSGIGSITREIVIHTSHHFNWINLGGSIKHPEKGKRLDLSEETNKQNNIEDASVYIYPVDGYGDVDHIREIIKIEKPDAIMLVTDPRYFTWLFAIENEIRRKIPIVYLNIWDNFPAPLYNLPYYESCDMLLSISKQTKLINKLVLEHGDVPYIDLDENKTHHTTKQKHPKVLKQISHGLNNNYFYPIVKGDKNWDELQTFKKQLFKDKEYDFVLFFNSRNIRRKQVPDTLLAYKYFIDKISNEHAKKCAFILHTELISEHGTDLEAVKELLLNNEKYNIIITNRMFNTYEMNFLYNITDAQILLSSNEGWGLSLTEALLCGKPIIANVTGGMQDQMRFSDENGNWFIPSNTLPSNNTGALQKHGMWAFPVYPTSRSMQGSPQTPYIWDDRCKPEDAAIRIHQLWAMEDEERKQIGLEGHKWAVGDEAGFTSIHQANKIIESFDYLFSTWKKRESYEIINVNEVKDRFINHNLLY